MKNATVAASVVAFALVIGGWAAVAASNDDATVQAVATAEEVPLDIPATVPKAANPGIVAAPPRAAAPVVRAVPVAALYSPIECAKPAKGVKVAPADALHAAGAAVATLGADYPETYTGHLGCAAAGRLIVYRVPEADFDSRVRLIAAREDVTLKLVEAPFSRQELTAMNEWIAKRKSDWAAHGIVVRDMGNKPNGTVEVRVDAADVAAAAKKLAKYRAQVRVVPYVKR